MSTEHEDTRTEAEKEATLKNIWEDILHKVVNNQINTMPSEYRERVSDGYHTFKELYQHRIGNYIAVRKLYQAIRQMSNYSPVWRSKRHSDGELAYGGGWFVLGIFTEPGQQITYHLPLSDWDRCAFAPELEQAPEWDGHTSDDVLTRLENL